MACTQGYPWNKLDVGWVVPRGKILYDENRDRNLAILASCFPGVLARHSEGRSEIVKIDVKQGCTVTDSYTWTLYIMEVFSGTF